MPGFDFEDIFRLDSSASSLPETVQKSASKNQVFINLLG